MKAQFFVSSRALINWFLCGFSVIVGLMLAGCETTGSLDEPSGEAPVTVSKGMSEAEVIALIGEPHVVDEIEHDGVIAQVWHYEKEVVLSSTIESDGEEERSYIDHKTGKVVIVREPIYRNERVKGRLIAELLMVDGKVVALKEREGNTDYEVGAGR